MQQENYFPTFKEWLRAVAAPNRRVRYKLKKRRHVDHPETEETPEAGEAFKLEGILKPGFELEVPRLTAMTSSSMIRLYFTANLPTARDVKSKESFAAWASVTR